MSKVIAADDVLARLESLIERAGSVRALAKARGWNPALISQCRKDPLRIPESWLPVLKLKRRKFVVFEHQDPE